jgi:hypothetical protein
MNPLFTSPEMSLILAWLACVFIITIGYYLLQEQKRS